MDLKLVGLPLHILVAGGQRHNKQWLRNAIAHKWFLSLEQADIHDNGDRDLMHFALQVSIQRQQYTQH